MAVEGAKVVGRVSRDKVEVETTEKCAICGKTDVGLLFARHKDLGYVGVCRDCWVRMFEDNLFVSGSGSSGGCCG